MELFSNILVPLIILYIVIYGKSKKIDIKSHKKRQL